MMAMLLLNESVIDFDDKVVANDVAGDKKINLNFFLLMAMLKMRMKR